MLAQRRGVRRLAGDRDDIADEALVAGRVLTGDDRGLGDGLMLAERGLDLAGLDAEAADLDLMVGTAEEMQRALGPPARPVAGAVHAAARWAGRRGVVGAAGGVVVRRAPAPGGQYGLPPPPRSAPAASRRPAHRLGCS